MKTTLIFCSYFMLLLNSAFCFAFDAKDIENYLDEMLSYQLDFKQQEKKLTSVIREVEEQLKNDDDNSYLWYLKGRSSFAAIYIFDKTDERYDKYKKLISIEFEKTLFLNKEGNILTIDQLYKLYTKSYSYSVSEDAARQYLALKKQKTTLHKKEHLRVLRERIVPLLIKQSKFDEALKELDYIDNEFPENAQGKTGNIAWRHHYEKEIETQKSKLAASEEPEKEKTTEPTEPEKPDPVVAAPRQPPVVKADEPLQKEEVLPETNNNQAIIVGAAIAILILIGFVVARRRK